jgi:hypothetical protein
MAQCYMGLLPSYFLAVQEAQGDLRSLPRYLGLIVLLVFLSLLLVRIVKLLRRTGHHQLWCLLALFPVLNLGALCFFAFKPWPTDKNTVNTGN